MQKKTKCSTFKIATGETFLKIQKFEFFQTKTQLCIVEKNPMDKKSLELFFYTSLSNFRALDSIIIFFSQN